MKHQLDIENWNRKEHFLLYKGFSEPYYGVCVRIDCTRAYERAKAMGVSFFLYYLYHSLAAAQQVENFRYRIVGDEVWVWDKIDAGSTIARDNGTFGFSHFLYTPDFKEFAEAAAAQIAQLRLTTGLERPAVDNLIRYSSLPWIDFTSISHARNFAFKDSCPMISFGKLTEQNGVKSMPVSVHVHHALVDGLHVGQFLGGFQRLMDEGSGC